MPVHEGFAPELNGSYRRKVTGQRSGETTAAMVEGIPCQVIFSSRQKKPVSFRPRPRDSPHCVKSPVGPDALCHPMAVRGKNLKINRSITCIDNFSKVLTEYLLLERQEKGK